jgi:glyoxylase I family protein
MAAFLRDVLGLAAADVPGVDADVFEFPDGSSFAVTLADEPRGERTIGFLVEDLDSAVAEMRVAGVDIDGEVVANERFRYMHFRAPDGQLYELVERRGG